MCPCLTVYNTFPYSLCQLQIVRARVCVCERVFARARARVCVCVIVSTIFTNQGFVLMRFPSFSITPGAKGLSEHRLLSGAGVNIVLIWTLTSMSSLATSLGSPHSVFYRLFP
jgi:hypothetical protein